MTATVQLSTEHEIQTAYRGTELAGNYLARRFESELNRVLHEQQVNVVNSVMSSRRPCRTLEIAPGPGRLTRDVRPAGTLTCLEFNEGMIAEGQRHCPGSVEWVQGNAFELPFDHTFEFVYSFRFIRHFHAADRQRLYEQIRCVLPSGGWFVMDAVNRPQSQPLRDAAPESYPVFDELYARADLIDELHAAGFDQIELTPVQKFYHWQLRSQTLIGPRSSRLNRWIIRGLEALPRRDGLEWVVTCRRA